jgi:allophanate hydrolase
MTTTAGQTAQDALAAARAEGLPVFISTPSSVDPLDGPLSGIPFAVKDNIDVAGLPATAACPALDQPATHHAYVVQRLVDAGAVVVGKTNLDQFATGLVGTRSPYGICTAVDDPTRISGGSSSGSAVAVASGIVPLALGTDTAGSGRVPAAFNGLVGVKSTREVSCRPAAPSTASPP